ncbi:hypothetical protein ABW636_21395 [Aquimarina sp. 2201CG1-2-11]|uniref:hypothetical protein n=1 Tax=Aquimarina discodermiae TaxID=3231043 RepID=UPI0034618452
MKPLQLQYFFIWEALGLLNTSILTMSKSHVYSPGVITPNQFVTVVAEILDENNIPTSIFASTEIYVY